VAQRLQHTRIEAPFDAVLVASTTCCAGATSSAACAGSATWSARWAMRFWLWDPDAFLQRTLSSVRWLFGTWGA
jgi:hypothetical protein